MKFLNLEDLEKPEQTYSTPRIGLMVNVAHVVAVWSTRVDLQSRSYNLTHIQLTNGKTIEMQGDHTPEIRESLAAADSLLDF